jgi:DMSO/TMAO reductase YedYZ molybdopterin-dependent catalytic subunit
MRFEALKPDQFLVPPENLFVRSHAATPSIDEKTWKLSIEGSGVDKPLSLSYDELLKLPSKTLTRSLECAGNGRSFYQTFLNKPAQGTQWKFGAYGVGEWTGVPLSELLQRAGLKPSATNVMAIGLDQPRVRRPLPLDRAMLDDTLLVYAMNGKPLLPDHGFPARLIVPGYVGVNSTKWVGTIQVAEEPLFSDWNTKTYVLIGPDYQPQGQALGPAVGEQVMKSALALPWPAELKAGQQTVRGYAWSPRGKIGKVEVSTDGGQSFQPARLVEPNVEKAGVRWEFSFEARPGDLTLTPRATDDQGNAQPLDLAQQKWNEQGYLWAVAVPHPVKVTA